jgi:hypothetical protein
LGVSAFGGDEEYEETLERGAETDKGFFFFSRRFFTYYKERGRAENAGENTQW